MKIAQILNNKVHWIFESDEIPNWPPDPKGNPIVLVDITGMEAEEGDAWPLVKKEKIESKIPWVFESEEGNNKEIEEDGESNTNEDTLESEEDKETEDDLGNKMKSLIKGAS